MLLFGVSNDGGLWFDSRLSASGGRKRRLRTPPGPEAADSHPGLLPGPHRERRKYSATAVSMQLLQLVAPAADSGYRLAGEH